MQTVSTDVQSYLEDHVADLLKRSQKGSLPPASFRSITARQRFTDLESGTRAQFLAAAQALATRLHTAMDARAKKGFFVALRQAKTIGRVAALKLDVKDKRAAVVRQIGPNVTLDSIKDLLDLPGELQKGAITPDVRPDSEVIVGDRASEETALYFLRAIEVQQVSPPRLGAGLLLRAVRDVAPDRVQQIAELVGDYGAAITPQELFAEHPEALSEDQRVQVLEDLERQTRPVRFMDPLGHPPKAVVQADDITITGPPRQMDEHVRWEFRGGEWVIEIRVSEEPRRTYQ
jgi:hypothetical protein